MPALRFSNPFLAFLAGLALTAGAAVSSPLGLPGVLLASVFWPQGVHTDGFSTASGTLFLATLSLGTLGFWSGVAYSLLRLRRPSTTVDHLPGS